MHSKYNFSNFTVAEILIKTFTNVNVMAVDLQGLCLFYIFYYAYCLNLKTIGNSNKPYLTILILENFTTLMRSKTTDLLKLQPKTFSSDVTLKS